MKLFSLATAILFAAALSAAKPIFYCSFDDTVTAVSKGPGKPVKSMGVEFRKGIRGKALLIGKDKNMNYHGLVYSYKNNLAWEQGTISFWVKSLTWKGSDTGFFVPFFSSKAGNNEFLIYKYFQGERLYFMRGEMGFWLFSQYAPGEWKPGEWHHVVCVWDPVHLSMYIDGNVVTERRIEFTPKGFIPRHDFTIGTTNKTIGASWKKSHLSLIDEFKIFDRTLTLAEIRKLYRENDPGLEPKNLITAPFGNKKFSAGAFSNKDNGEYAIRQNQYTISYDKKNLYVSLKKYTRGDQVVLTSPAKKKYTFAFNGKGIAVPLAKTGLKPGVKGWQINIISGNTDLRGGARLRLDPAAPAMTIPQMYDLKNNTKILTIGKYPNVNYLYDRDTTFNYGFSRRTGSLAKGFTIGATGGATRGRRLPDWILATLELQQKGKAFYRTDLAVRKNQPLTVKFVYTKIKKRRLFVAFQGKNKGKAVVELVRPNGSVADTQKLPLPEKSFNFFNLEFPIKAAPGDYNIKIYHQAPNGRRQHVYTQQFRVPPANDPLVAEYRDPDADKLPPGGWTPVKAGKNTVSVWGRKYTLDKGFFFSSLITQGKELLAEPDKLLLDGKVLVPRSVKLKKLSSTILEAVYKKEMDFGKLKTESLLTVHFDGYVDIKMKVIPASPMKIKSLVLELPMKNERLTLLRDNAPQSRISGKAGKKFSVPLLPIATVWVGDYYRGINFAAENLENWYWRGNAHHAEMRRDSKAARMYFKFISAPYTLKKALDYRFTFTVTPVKPLNRKMLRQRAKKEIQSWFQPWKYFSTFSADKKDLLSNFDAFYSSQSRSFKELYWYSGYVFTSPFIGPWTWYEENWRQVKHNRNYGVWTGTFPGAYCEGCIEGKEYRNYRLNNWAQFMRKDNPLLKKGTKNFYFDSAYEESCFNTNHGCKLWTDATGKKRTKMSIYHYRSMALNVYRMIKRLGPESKVSYHTEWGRQFPCHSFNDYMMGGEGQEHTVAANNGYYDLLTPDRFAVSFSPYIYSVKMSIIPQVRRGIQIGAPAKYRTYNINKPIWRKAHLHYMGLAAVHDVDIEYADELCRIWWKAQDALGWNDKTVFHPYFADAPAVKTAPVSDRIVASAYTNSGKLMLAVLNDTDKTQKVTVSLDLKKLGVKKGLKGADVWEPSSKYTLDSRVTVTIPPRGFRLINFLGK